VVAFAQAQKIESTETRSLPTFRKINSGGEIEIVLIRGSEETAKITAKNVPLKDIRTEVRGGELLIDMEYKKYAGNNNKSIKIELTYIQLESIKISGAGSLTAESTIKAPNLSIRVSGAGNINIPVETLDLKADVSGAGNLTIKGKADKQNIEVSGAGNYKGFELATLNTTTRISGAGNVDVFVTGALEGRISGAGGIRYKGSPKNKDIQTSGAGSAKAVE